MNLTPTRIHEAQSQKVLGRSLQFQPKYLGTNSQQWYLISHLYSEKLATTTFSFPATVPSGPKQFIWLFLFVFIKYFP